MQKCIVDEGSGLHFWRLGFNQIGCIIQWVRNDWIFIVVRVITGLYLLRR